MRNLHQLFDWQYIGQIIGGDFAKFCGLLRIYELYVLCSNKAATNSRLLPCQDNFRTRFYEFGFMCGSCLVRKITSGLFSPISSFEDGHTADGICSGHCTIPDLRILPTLQYLINKQEGRVELVSKPPRS